MPTPKQETILSHEWIKNLTKTVAERSLRIKLFKIHGEQFQDTGISDWIGCWQGRFLAIEFKVHPKIVMPRQRDFLLDIIENNGIGFVVEFHKRPAITTMSPDTTEGWNKDGYYVRGQEYLALLRAATEQKEFIYEFIY